MDYGIKISFDYFTQILLGYNPTYQMRFSTFLFFFKRLVDFVLLSKSFFEDFDLLAGHVFSWDVDVKKGDRFSVFDWRRTKTFNNFDVVQCKIDNSTIILNLFFFIQTINIELKWHFFQGNYTLHLDVIRMTKFFILFEKKLWKCFFIQVINAQTKKSFTHSKNYINES